VETLIRDLHYAFRTIRNNPGFSAVALIALALGIGANTAIFSVINALILRQPPFKDAARIVYLWETSPTIGLDRGIVSPSNFVDWREQSTTFEQISAWRTWFYRLAGDGEPEQVWGVRTSANFFDLLGVEASHGRTFLSDEELPGMDHVVVLSHRIWTGRFAADPNIVGRSINVDDEPFTIIGILPADFNLFGSSRSYDLWMPFDFGRGQLGRDDYSLIVFARLKRGVSLERAQSEMNSISERLAQAYPATNQNRGIKVITLQENQVLTLKPALMVLVVAAGFVLLIACVNVANLLLARGATRQRETALKLALGASRGRLIRGLLTESILLSLIGGLLGLLAALWGLDVLRAILPTGAAEVPRTDWIVIDRTVLFFAILISILTGVVFGLAPALQVDRFELNQALKDNGITSAVSTRRRLMDFFVIGEIALAMILLVGAGLMIRSLLKFIDVQPGFNPDNLLTMQVWLPESRYAKPGAIAAFYRQALDRIRQLPEIRSATAVDFLPSSGWSDSTAFEIDGPAATSLERDTVVQYRVIDYDYFRVMGIPLIRGRSFDDTDREGSNSVVIINDAMARRFWPGQDPLGHHIRTAFPNAKAPWRPQSSNAWLTIVGITQDVKEIGASYESSPELYLPYLQSPSALMRLVIRGDVRSADLASHVRREILEIDKDQPVTEVKSMNQFLKEASFRRSFNALLLGVFAGVALVLASIGIYGVMRYAVTQRTREVGIRIALGAQPRDVLRVIMGRGLTLTLVGVGMGAAGAFALTRLMANLLFGVSASDPLTFATISLILAGVALAACFMPARRALKVDPMIALRHE
jgi:putative ABC transport system permease protein